MVDDKRGKELKGTGKGFWETTAGGKKGFGLKKQAWMEGKKPIKKKNRRGNLYINYPISGGRNTEGGVTNPESKAEAVGR